MHKIQWNFAINSLELIYMDYTQPTSITSDFFLSGREIRYDFTWWECTIFLVFCSALVLSLSLCLTWLFCVNRIVRQHPFTFLRSYICGQSVRCVLPFDFSTIECPVKPENERPPAFVRNNNSHKCDAVTCVHITLTKLEAARPMSWICIIVSRRVLVYCILWFFDTAYALNRIGVIKLRVLHRNMYAFCHSFSDFIFIVQQIRHLNIVKSPKSRLPQMLFPHRIAEAQSEHLQYICSRRIVLNKTNRSYSKSRTWEIIELMPQIQSKWRRLCIYYSLLVYCASGYMKHENFLFYF